MISEQWASVTGSNFIIVTFVRQRLSMKKTPKSMPRKIVQ